MPVVVLRLPTSTLARFGSERNPPPKLIHPHMNPHAISRHGRAIPAQPRKRAHEQLSSDDTANLTVIKKKPRIVLQELRSTSDDIMVPGLSDWGQSTTKDGVTTPFVSADTNSKESKTCLLNQSHPSSAPSALGLELKTPSSRFPYNFGQLGGEVEQFEDHVIQLRTRANQLQDNFHHMYSDINVIHTEMEAMKIRKRSLAAVIQEARLAFNRTADRVEKLNGENRDLMSEKHDLAVKNSKLEEQVTSLKLEIKKFRKETKISLQANSDLTSEKKRLVARNDKLEGDVKKLELNVKKSLEEAKCTRQSLEAYRKRVQALGNEF